jgi:hypothetical protein
MIQTQTNNTPAHNLPQRIPTDHNPVTTNPKLRVTLGAFLFRGGSASIARFGDDHTFSGLEN